MSSERDHRKMASTDTHAHREREERIAVARGGFFALSFYLALTYTRLAHITQLVGCGVVVFGTVCSVHSFEC